MTFGVDWALKANYLSFIFSVSSFFEPWITRTNYVLPLHSNFKIQSTSQTVRRQQSHADQSTCLDPSWPISVKELIRANQSVSCNYTSRPISVKEPLQADQPQCQERSQANQSQRWVGKYFLTPSQPFRVFSRAKHHSPNHKSQSFHSSRHFAVFVRRGLEKMK